MNQSSKQSKESGSRHNYAVIVVLDTNVLISALIHDGIARNFLTRLISQNHLVVLSDYIVRETEEVLRRAKFSNREILNQLWKLVKKDAMFVNLKPSAVDFNLRDPKDHPILQTALAAGAKFLVTGDQDLLVLKNYQDIKIVTISEASATLSGPVGNY